MSTVKARRAMYVASQVYSSCYFIFLNTLDLAVLITSKIAITNALTFDGYSLLRNHTFAIKNDLIVGLSSLEDVFGAKVIDGAGQTLLPGLLDAHVHLSIDPDDSARLLL